MKLRRNPILSFLSMIPKYHSIWKLQLSLLNFTFYAKIFHNNLKFLSFFSGNQLSITKLYTNYCRGENFKIKICLFIYWKFGWMLISNIFINIYFALIFSDSEILYSSNPLSITRFLLQYLPFCTTFWCCHPCFT